MLGDDGPNVPNPYKSPSTTNGRAAHKHRASCTAIIISAGVIALGLLLFAASFAYHVVAVGIPPQDPTPEDVIRNNFHFNVVRTMAFAGMGMAMFGIFAFCCTGLWSLSSDRR